MAKPPALPPVLPSKAELASMVQVTVSSSNRKTGVLTATSVSQASCPNGENSSYKCPLLGSGCYAEASDMWRFVTSKLNKASDFDKNAPAATDLYTPEQLAQAEADALDKKHSAWLKTKWHPDKNSSSLHQALRIHVVGDCVTAESARIVARAADKYSQALPNGGNSAYGYTHGWRDYPRSAWGRISVLASCDTMADIKNAMSKGWAPAAVIQRYQFSEAKKNFGGVIKLTNGTTMLPCPYEAERSLQHYQEEKGIPSELKKHWDLTGMPPIDKPIVTIVKVKDKKTGEIKEKEVVTTQQDWIKERRFKDVQCVECKLCMRDQFLKQNNMFIAFAVHGKEGEKIADKLINIDPYLPAKKNPSTSDLAAEFDWSMRDDDRDYTDVIKRWWAYEAEASRVKNPDDKVVVPGFKPMSVEQALQSAETYREMASDEKSRKKKAHFLQMAEAFQKAAGKKNPSLLPKAKSFVRGKTQAMRRLKAAAPKTNAKASRVEGYAMQPKGMKNPKYTKTRLDLLLDRVKYGKHEVTFDVRGYTEAEKRRVITAAEARGFDASSDGKHILVRQLKRSNPSSEASQMYSKFHGRPSKSVLEIPEREHVHKHLAQLGTLTEVKVRLKPLGPAKDQRLVTLGAGDAQAHEDSKAIHLCTSEDATSLYFVGGDQKLDLNALGFSKDDIKDLMLIGEVVEITYRTQKNFDKFKTLDYFHGLSEVTKRNRPVLLYKPRDKKMLMAGGEYRVKPEGIVN